MDDNQKCPWFSVEGKNEERGVSGVSYLRKVYVTVNGITVTLMKARRTRGHMEEVEEGQAGQEQLDGGLQFAPAAKLLCQGFDHYLADFLEGLVTRSETFTNGEAL
ncbi:hypothetical protein INR49_014981 [Caranx melampygus]|nr:hypothetical protein INR49_014981 [Caranx melampygus]